MSDTNPTNNMGREGTRVLANMCDISKTIAGYSMTTIPVSLHLNASCTMPLRQRVVFVQVYSFHVKEVKWRLYVFIMLYQINILKAVICFSTIVLNRNTSRIKRKLNQTKTLYSCIIYMQYINL